MTDFERSLAFTLKWEGGLTTDSGGLTKYGISQNSYPDLDIANLTLEQVKEIYKRDYWDALLCDNFDWPWNIVVFDGGINCGVFKMKDWIFNSKTWQDILLKRILHYTNLAQKPKYQPYFRGWMNRVMDLYRTVSED